MKKIAVVDDDPFMRDFICEILGRAYTVVSADNGADGLELIRRERPDLVVLDLLMPRMHGYEVCQRLRQDASFQTLKILISSSKSYANDQSTAKVAGADMYLVKPFEIATLTSAVERLLGDVEAATKVVFWGARGSVPTPGENTRRYGGNTPCVELRAGRTVILIDAGTGLREWGNTAMKEYGGKPINAHLFIGHTHWDHIQGFPFCTPLYLPQNRFRVYGAHGTTQGFEAALAGQMNPTYFPVALNQMQARLDFIEIDRPLDIDGVKVTTHYLNHPGITIGFRLEAPGGVVCYISDHEPYGRLNQKGEFSAREDAAVAEFVRDADILISEAQYTEEEYKVKRSWGHSTFSDVAGLAAAAGAKRLVLFHHDPMHTDEMMDRFLEDCRRQLGESGRAIECLAAQEGSTLGL